MSTTDAPADPNPDQAPATPPPADAAPAADAPAPEPTPAPAEPAAPAGEPITLTDFCLRCSDIGNDSRLIVELLSGFEHIEARAIAAGTAAPRRPLDQWRKDFAEFTQKPAG